MRITQPRARPPFPPAEWPGEQSAPTSAAGLVTTAVPRTQRVQWRGGPPPRGVARPVVAPWLSAVDSAAGRIDPDRRLLAMLCLSRSFAFLASASLLVSLSTACASPANPAGAPPPPAATAAGQAGAAAGPSAAAVPPAREAVRIPYS